MRGLPSIPLVALLVGVAVGAAGTPVGGQDGRPSPVGSAHIRQINEAFRANGISGGWVNTDNRGRVELQGSYATEREVDRAFSLAQTVVGVRWVSPVTPANIKVKEWATCLSNLLSGQPCGPSAAAGPFPPEAPAAPPVPVPAEAPPGPITEKYALVVGVGRFQYGINQLQYANKDAYDFYTYLVDPSGGSFRQENVILLRDAYATRERIRAALDRIKSLAQPNDMVLVYFSTHGTPPGKYGGVHLVTYDSQPRPRERIWETSVTDEMLRDFIQNVRAKRLVMIMDACYSNGAYARVPGFLPPGGKSLGGTDDEGSGRSRTHMARRLLGMKDLVVESDEAPQPPAISAQGWGRVLISASDAGERSWESDTLRNSIFTRYFVEGLRRYQGNLREAFAYATPLVRDQVKREKGPDIDQNPQATATRSDWDIPVAAPGR